MVSYFEFTAKRLFWHLSVGSRATVSFFAFIVFVAIISSDGCQSQPLPTQTHTPRISFESLCGLTHEQFSEMGETQVQEWLQKRYKIVPTYYSPYSQISPNEAGYFVQLNTQESINVYLRQGKLYLINIFQTEPINFEHLVNDLGVPQTISASEYRPITFEGTAAYDIGLHYPRNGLSIHNSTWTKAQSAILLQRELVVNFLQCYVPDDSMETVEQKRFPWTTSLTKQLTWPGFDELVDFKYPMK